MASAGGTICLPDTERFFGELSAVPQKGEGPGGPCPPSFFS